MLTQTTERPSPAPQPSLFKNRNFLLLWLAQIISSLGDWALLIAIPVTVYDGTNSPSKLGLALLAETAPALLLGVFAGVIVDRCDRRILMIVSDLGRMVTVTLLLGVHDLHHLGHHDLWLIYGAASLTAAFSSFFWPARSSLMAALLPRERLMQGNALSSSSLRLTQLLGPALAAVLLYRLRTQGIFVFDSLTFLFSAICIVFVADPEVKRDVPRGLAGVGRDLREGLAYLAPGTVLGRLISFLAVTTFAGGVFNALLYVFAKRVLNLDGPGFAFLLSALGLGAFLAVPLVAGPLKNAPPPPMIAAGFVLMAVAMSALACAPGVPVGAVAMFFIGLGNLLMFLPALTMCQTEPPPEVRGRVMGALGTNSAFLTASSALSVALLVGHAPPLRAIFLGIASVYLVCGLMAQPLLGRNLVPKRP